LIDGKRYGYHDKKDLEINFNPDENNKFVFIRGNYSDFSRMISNVINNAVESREEEVKVEVSYGVKGEEVEVKVKDNGSGMPQEMIEKLNRGEAVGTTKEYGHGIGMEQILKTIKDMKGKMEVKSVEGEGTEFVMRFKKVEAPKWFARKIEIKKGDIVVILDDEILMYEIWRKRLKGYEKDLTIKYFKEGVEALNYLKTIEDKSKVFLIVDYELKKQEINGIEVIEKSGMKERHILMTNKYLRDIKEFKGKSNFLKLFHKMYLNDIDIVVS
jgi:archaellum component FlaF (FlaF/FlaG flagellin family)